MRTPSVHRTLSLLRAAVGVMSWVGPATTRTVFGLGAAGDAGVDQVTRLFGVRDLTLGLAASHPDPHLARTALQAGVLVDSVDAVASLIAYRRGGSRSALALVGGGAVLFASLGLIALEQSRDPG